MDKNLELLEGAQELKDWEGYEPFPYLDTENIETQGIGRNLEVYPMEPDELEPDGSYSEVNAVAWAYDKLAECRQSVVIHNPWCISSPPRVRIILTDMAYNLGIAGLMKFKNMIQAMKNQEWVRAAEELRDSKYYKQTGRRAEAHYQSLLKL